MVGGPAAPTSAFTTSTAPATSYCRRLTCYGARAAQHRRWRNRRIRLEWRNIHRRGIGRHILAGACVRRSAAAAAAEAGKARACRRNVEHGILIEIHR